MMCLQHGKAHKDFKFYKKRTLYPDHKRRFRNHVALKNPGADDFCSAHRPKPNLGDANAGLYWVDPASKGDRFLHPLYN